jgi:4-hydroxy-tetrahydrodipicolinate synthase
MIKNETLLFGRLITAMVTPFDDDDKVDFKAVEKIVNHLIATGSDALVVNGTTGESPTLEESEKKELLKAVVALVGKRAKVIMGTGSNITSKSVKATQQAQELGADGALVVAPYYNKPNQAGLTAHFSAIAEATTLPLIVYNIPGRTGINIQNETMVELSRSYKNIHALKDSTGNVEQASDVASAASEDFVIYSGDDYLTLPFLSVGASGVISVASHVVGREICQMQNSFFAGRLDEARSIHYKLMAMFKGLFQAPNPTCVKYILSRLGFCKENLRLPLVPLNSQQKEAMDKLVASYELSLVSR